MAVGRFFFSAAPTVQNSPELHFRFINSFIQPSRVGSLVVRYHCVLEKRSLDRNSLDRGQGYLLWCASMQSLKVVLHCAFK